MALDTDVPFVTARPEVTLGIGNRLGALSAELYRLAGRIHSEWERLDPMPVLGATPRYFVSRAHDMVAFAAELCGIAASGLPAQPGRNHVAAEPAPLSLDYPPEQE